jgi:toxin-antitoxin system PIN domain toxin
VRVADLNLLVYAFNRDAPQHPAARRWLEQRLGGDETFGLSWAVVLGFVRLMTNPRIFERPISAERALAIVDGWLALPVVELVAPGERHWTILRALLTESGVAGNLTTDAHLAAIAIEQGAELESADGDFARFRGLRWSNPLLSG